MLVVHLEGRYFYENSVCYGGYWGWIQRSFELWMCIWFWMHKMNKDCWENYLKMIFWRCHVQLVLEWIGLIQILEITNCRACWEFMQLFIKHALDFWERSKNVACLISIWRDFKRFSAIGSLEHQITLLRYSKSFFVRTISLVFTDFVFKLVMMRYATLAEDISCMGRKSWLMRMFCFSDAESRWNCTQHASIVDTW